MSAWQVTGALERAGFRIDTKDRRCPDGLLGRLFGHKWMTVDQVEIPSDGKLPFNVYRTQRCKRCHMENGDFNRIYKPGAR